MPFLYTNRFYRSFHPKKSLVESLLATPSSTAHKTTPLSEGYGSGEEESGEEEEGGGVEVVEDYAALEEEGVPVAALKRSKFAIMEVCVCVCVLACVCACVSE